MKIYTEAAICRVLGIKKSELNAMIRTGAIRSGITPGGLFKLEETAREIIATYGKHGQESEIPDYATERARLMRAKRKSEEYDLGLKRGDLHKTEDIEEALSQVLVSFKAKISAIPSRAAPQVAKMESSADVFDFLKKLTDEALEELSDFDNITGADGRPDDEQ